MPKLAFWSARSGFIHCRGTVLLESSCFLYSLYHLRLLAAIGLHLENEFLFIVFVTLVKVLFLCLENPWPLDSLNRIIPVIITIGVALVFFSFFDPFFTFFLNIL